MLSVFTDGSLRLERRELWCTVNNDEFSQRGWVQKTDEAKQIFMRGVAKDLCWMNEEVRGKALVSEEGNHLLSCCWD